MRARLRRPAHAKKLHVEGRWLLLGCRALRASPGRPLQPPSRAELPGPPASRARSAAKAPKPPPLYLKLLLLLLLWPWSRPSLRSCVGTSSGLESPEVSDELCAWDRLLPTVGGRAHGYGARLELVLAED